MSFVVLLACLVSFAPSGYAASTDDIMNACYEIKGSRCGAKNHMKAIGAVAGFAVGPLVPVPISNGLGMAIVPGGPLMQLGTTLAGMKLGGKINYTANEYLYFDNDTCLECDVYQMGEHYECPNGTIVSNGTHIMKCQTQTFGDSWTEYTIPICSNSAIQSGKAQGAIVDIRATVNKTLSSVPGVQVFSGDVCYMISCPQNSTYDASKNECVGYNPNCATTTAGSFKSVGDKAKIECDRGYNGNEINGKFAYDGKLHSIGHVIKGDVDKCVAECKSEGWYITLIDQSSCESGYKPDDAKKACIGEAKTPTSKPVTPVVNPVIPNEPVPPIEIPDMPELFICDADKVLDLESWRSQWRNDSEILLKIDYLLQYCNGNPQKNEFIQRYNEITNLINKRKIAENASKGKITEIKGELDGMVSGLKQTVWRTKEGDFNAARLASDSIAGVVLGTAGGLITSKIVKKSQVKSGFEDIQCTIGGQNVADWHDEFTVGIQ